MSDLFQNQKEEPDEACFVCGQQVNLRFVSGVYLCKDCIQKATREAGGDFIKKVNTMKTEVINNTK